MTNDEFLEEFLNLTNEMNALVQRKNLDYSGEEDPFKNFSLVEKITNGEITTEMGIYTRMLDKVSRIGGLMKGSNPAVSEEKIKDTLLDLANYSLIFMLYLENKNSNLLQDFAMLDEDNSSF